MLFSSCENQYFWQTRYKRHTTWHWELRVNVFICLWPSAPILYEEHSPASHMSSCQNSADRTKQRKTSQLFMIQDLQTCGNNHSKKQVVISWEILMEHFCSLLFVLLSNPIWLNMVTEDYVSVIKSNTWGRLCISNKPRRYLGYCTYYFFSPPGEQRIVIDYFW